MRCGIWYDLINRFSFWQRFRIFNSISGTFPIDTSKTRLQIQGQKFDAKYSKMKYRGMIDCIVKIAKEEGVRALYAGYVLNVVSVTEKIIVHL